MGLNALIRAFNDPFLCSYRAFTFRVVFAACRLPTCKKNVFVTIPPTRVNRQIGDDPRRLPTQRGALTPLDSHGQGVLTADEDWGAGAPCRSSLTVIAWRPQTTGTGPSKKHRHSSGALGEELVSPPTEQRSLASDLPKRG